MKYEWKKHEKNLYTNLTKPAIVTVPDQNYIMISGTGNPNGEDFAARVGVLMSLAYSIKMRHKAACDRDSDYASQFACGDYAVYPLEGVWTSTAAPADGAPLDKESFVYTIMVRQPDFATIEMYEAACADVERKKPNPLLEEVQFGSMEDGVCIQMLHVGPFDDEPGSFALMNDYAKEAGYERKDHVHREIYLSDARKTTPDKYRTILRYRVMAGEPK